MIGHFAHRDAVQPEELRGAAGGEDLDAVGEQRLCELDDAGLQAIERDIIGAIEAAVAFAEASPFPLPEQATDDVFSA